MSVLLLIGAVLLGAPAPPEELKDPGHFADLADEETRAKALFGEVAKVLLHPRCANCHPATPRPLQTDAQRPHIPWVVRGQDGEGAPGLTCDTCHGETNDLQQPGAPHWHLAPAEMAWIGKTAGEVCRQLKDPARNGGRTLEAVHRHLAEDPLEAYGWRAPKHLQPAPGTQARLAAPFRAWIEAGAHCPQSRTHP